MELHSSRNTATGESIANESAGALRWRSISFSQNGKSYVTDEGCLFKVENLLTHKNVIFPIASFATAAVQTFPENSFVGCKTGEVFQVYSNGQMQLVDGLSEKVVSLAVSPDEYLRAAGTERGLFKVWDQLTGRSWTCRADESPVIALAFRPGCHEIVTGSQNGAVRIWTLPSRPRKELSLSHDHTHNSKFWTSR